MQIPAGQILIDFTKLGVCEFVGVYNVRIMGMSVCFSVAGLHIKYLLKWA